MLHTKYQSFMSSSYRQEEFWSWSASFLCSILWPPGQGQFWPQGHHMNKLGRGPQGDDVYQISKLYAFQFQRKRISKISYLPNIKALGLPVSENKNFGIFFLSSYVPTCDPPGQGKFWPLGHHMNKLGRGPLEYATYKISKLWRLQCGTKRFSKISFFTSIWNLRAHNIGQISTTGSIIWSILVEGH